MRNNTIFILLFYFAFITAAEAKNAADLQFSLCSKATDVEKAFGLAANQAEERVVYLFETKDAKFLNNDVNLRLRRSDERADFAVKLFRLTRQQFKDLKKHHDGDCEIDVHQAGTERIYSCTFNQKMEVADADKLISGRKPVGDLLNKQQQDVLGDRGLLSLTDDALALGPIDSHAWKWPYANNDSDKYALETQSFPSGTRYIEISVKTESEKLSDRTAEMLQILHTKGLKLCQDQSGQRPEKICDLLGNCVH